MDGHPLLLRLGTPIDFEAVLDSSDNSIQFNYNSLVGGGFQDNGAYATVGIKDDNGGVNGSDSLLLDFNTGPNAFVNSFLSTKIAVGIGGTPDYYAVPLTAGQSSTIAVKGSGGKANLGLYDGSGNLIALSASGQGTDGVISNFVAPSTGTYYVKVSGAPGLQYDLVVTRGSDFSLHSGNFNSAQPLDGASVVLGAITQGGGGLQALDLQSFSFSNIYQTDPVTGAFGSHIVSPNNDGFYLFGQNMASDGTYTYYNDGFGGSGIIYKLDSTARCRLDHRA